MTAKGVYNLQQKIDAKCKLPNLKAATYATPKVATKKYPEKTKPKNSQQQTEPKLHREFCLEK